jgi:hypothetical protein
MAGDSVIGPTQTGRFPRRKLAGFLEKSWRILAAAGKNRVFCPARAGAATELMSEKAP